MTYSIQEVRSSGIVEIDTRSDKDAAVHLAAARHLEMDGQLEIIVMTDKGTVVHTIPAVEAKAEIEPEAAAEEEVEVLEDADAPEEVIEEAVSRTKPWSKTDVAKTFDAPEIAGYELAYTRERTKTGIYRAADKSDWLVFDTRVEDDDYAGEHFANTTEARMRTNELMADYRAEVDRARDEAKAAKARAAKTKAEAKKAADEAKAKEKELAKKEKEAAKAAKEEEADADSEEKETVDA